MTHYTFTARAVCAAALLGLAAAAGGAETNPPPIRAEGAEIQLDSKARLVALHLAGRSLRVRREPLVQLCPAGRKEFESPAAEPGEAAGAWRLRFPRARATVALNIRPAGRLLKFDLAVQGDSLPARGLLLRVQFPFDARGWRWSDDMQTARVIADGKLYENVRSLRAFADLPEWADQPDLRMGYSNRNFCTVAAGPVGACLAAPIDRPCLFRTAYDAKARRLQIVYDFALSPRTREPNAARFSFDLYACDPRWAFRDALATYYQAYPELFRNYIEEPGQWMAFTRLSDIDNANEFYFGLQEGAPEPEYDDRIGVLSTVYFTHAGMGARIPGFDPEKQPLPPYDVQVKAMEAAFKRRTGIDGLYHKVGLYNAAGRLDVRPWKVYAHLIAQFNLDPDLPYGAWTLRRALRLIESVQEKRHARLDGFYYDGLSSGLNYRPDHFRTADAPCLWDPRAKKPFLNNFFSSCEFARAAAERLRPRGRITMMNGALHASFFVAPWLDVLGSETGLRIPRESFNYIRATTYHKPFLTLLKGNYEQKLGHAQIELFMKRCLAYGVFPGFFDWPPSGLGPGGRYWDHPRYYERDRGLFRKYLPLCRALAKAGWEPVTHASCDGKGVFVERFGPDPDGVVWLTLLNETQQTQRVRLTIDAAALRLPARVQALDAVSECGLRLTRQADALSTHLDLPGDGVMAIQLAAPEAAARWRVRQALDTLDRGRLMRQVDRGKPALPVHWRTRGAAPASIQTAPRAGLRIRGDGRSSTALSQWAMLFQSRPAPLTLRVRAAARGLDARRGAVRVRCRLAWVTRSFTHYEMRVFSLPGGDYAAKEFAFPIRCEHPLRAVLLSLEMRRPAKGELRVERVSLVDASGRDAVVDPAFREWYEPVPKAMRPRLDSETAALRRALTALLAAAPTVRSDAARAALQTAFGCSRRLRRWIRAERAENGCRRVLRDLETIERHLGRVALLAYGVEPPQLTAPASAAPGDAARVRFPAPQAAGAPARTEVECAFPVTRDGEDFVVHIPEDAAIGSAANVTGVLSLGPAGREAVVRASRVIRIVAPLEVAAESAGSDAEDGSCRLRVTVTNHRGRPVEATLSVRPPEGWTAAPAPRLRGGGGE